MGSPGAIDMLPPLKLVQIHTFYQLSSLPFKLLEKSNRRLLIGFLLLPVLFYFEVHQAANKFPIKDINLLSKKSTKLMTALGRVVFLTLFCDCKCSKMTPVKNSLSCSRFNLAELQILLLLMKASIKSSRTSWRCSYFISQQPLGRLAQSYLSIVPSQVLLNFYMLTCHHDKSYMPTL